MTSTALRVSTLVPKNSHSRVDLPDPRRWVLYGSHFDGHVRRLIVFIHGFLGKSVGTWLDFPEIDVSQPDSQWWIEADLLFVGYESTKDDITGVANRVRQQLGRFYPQPARDALTIRGIPARSDLESPYEELVMVGHSLGGLILRRMLSDAAQDWIDRKRPHDSRPALLDSQNRMFSPASAGFRAAGLLGLARAVPAWTAIEMIARRASAYTDLQPNSVTLKEIKDRTEALRPDIDTELQALRANIVWASPDNVVIAERYKTDLVDASWDGKSHTSVCKPHRGMFDLPWKFVRSGEAY